MAKNFLSLKLGGGGPSRPKISQSETRGVPQDQKFSKRSGPPSKFADGGGGSLWVICHRHTLTILVAFARLKNHLFLW